MKRRIPQLPREIWNYIFKIKTYTDNLLQRYQKYLFEHYWSPYGRAYLRNKSGVIRSRCMNSEPDWDKEEQNLYMTLTGIWDEEYQQYVYPKFG